MFLLGSSDAAAAAALGLTLAADTAVGVAVCATAACCSAACVVLCLCCVQDGVVCIMCSCCYDIHRPGPKPSFGSALPPSLASSPLDAGPSYLCWAWPTELNHDLQHKSFESEVDPITFRLLTAA